MTDSAIEDKIDSVIGDEPSIDDAQVDAPDALRRGRPPKRKRVYFRSVNGFTDGNNFFGIGDVFVETDTILMHWERTEGRDGSRVLYVLSDQDAYNEQEARRLAEAQSGTGDVQPRFEGIVDRPGLSMNNGMVTSSGLI